MGWFYGCKRHIIINDRSELLSFCLTPGNVTDREPVPMRAKELWGKLIGERGYLGQELLEKMMEKGLQVITPLKKNMDNKLMPIMDKLLVRKRGVIESVTDQLKNGSMIEHTRHRNIFNFGLNLLVGLIAYTWQPNKPSINLSDAELAQFLPSFEANSLSLKLHILFLLFIEFT